MDYAFLPTWDGFLPRQGGHVLGFCGSEGKVSLLKEVAGLYLHLGLGVIETATVPLPGRPETLSQEWLPDHTVPALCDEPVVRVHGGVTADGDWAGLEAGVVDHLQEQFPDRVILCRVDGGGPLPLKFYGPSGLSWPRSTTLAVVMVEGSAVGAQTGTVLQGAGVGCASPGGLDGLAAHELFEWKHLEALVLGKAGYLDQVPADLPVVLAVTGLEDVADSIGLFGFAGRVMQHERLPLVMFCSRKEGVWQLKTAYRTGSGEVDGE